MIHILLLALWLPHCLWPSLAWFSASWPNSRSRVNYCWTTRNFFHWVSSHARDHPRKPWKIRNSPSRSTDRVGLKKKHWVKAATNTRRRLRKHSPPVSPQPIQVNARTDLISWFSALLNFSLTFTGYGATCVALVLSAVTILKESDKLPSNGGVYPPGACFAHTNMISNLSKNGFTFEVLSSHETVTKKDWATQRLCWIKFRTVHSQSENRRLLAGEIKNRKLLIYSLFPLNLSHPVNNSKVKV